MVGGYVVYRKLVLGESIVPDEATRAKEAYQKLHGRKPQDSSSTTHPSMIDAKPHDNTSKPAAEKLDDAKNSPLSQDQLKDR